jgi:hypothetical protein
MPWNRIEQFRAGVMKQAPENPIDVHGLPRLRLRQGCVTEETANLLFREAGA